MPSPGSILKIKNVEPVTILILIVPSFKCPSPSTTTQAPTPSPLLSPTLPQPSTPWRLIQVESQDQWAKGLCFNYNERYIVALIDIIEPHKEPLEFHDCPLTPKTPETPQAQVDMEFTIHSITGLDFPYNMRWERLGPFMFSWALRQHSISSI